MPIKSMLLLGGHLDDSVIAAGGIIRKLADSGCKVEVVCFGNGDEAFTNEGEKEEKARQFRAEASEAHEILGAASFKCLNVPDFAVQENRDAYRACMKEIRESRPEIILGHYWAEYFQHRAMARLSCDSWWQAGWECSADLGRPWSARALYHFEVLHDLPEPTHIIDVSDTFEHKIKAFEKFKVAGEHLGELSCQLEARAVYHGSKIGVKYAEVLKKSFFIPERVRDPAGEL